jgi:hypothetical protein
VGRHTYNPDEPRPPNEGEGFPKNKHSPMSFYLFRRATEGDLNIEHDK